MPKELLEIKRFQAGTITTPSSTDIPLEAASDSLNIDPISENGKLEGLPNDMVLDTDKTFKDSSSSEESFKFSKATVINDSGTDRVVAYNPTDNKLYKIDGFVDGASANSIRPTAISSTALISSSDEVTFEKNNKEVHIGTGTATTDTPKWCGVIPHGQFGASATSGLQIDDAKLKSPSTFSVFDKVFCNQSETYIFGYEIGGTAIYKFDIATKSLYDKSGDIFDDIMAACRSDKDNDDFIWVLNDDSGTFTLKKVDMNTLKITESYATYGVSPDWTDMINVYADNGGNNFIWGAQSTAGSGDYIYRADISTTSLGDTVTFALKRPAGAGSATSAHGSIGIFIYYNSAAGRWDEVDTHGQSQGAAGRTTDHINVFFKPTSITNSSSNAWVGYACQLYTSGGGKDVYFVHDTGCTHTGSGDCAHRVKVIDSGAAYGTMVSYIMRDDFSNLFALDSVSSTGSILSQGKGGLVLTNLAHNLKYQGFCATNDDTGIIITEDGSTSTESDLWTVALPDSSTISGASISLSATAGSNLDLDNPCGVVIKDSSTIKTHLFNGAVLPRWAYGELDELSAYLESNVEITISASSSGGTLDSSKKYFYRASFVYDGYQESPMVSFDLASNSPSSGSTNSHQLTIKLRAVTTFSKRITDINIYRATGGGSDTTPTGFFRLLESVKVDSRWLTTEDTSTNPAWEDYRQVVISDLGNVGASYESLNGISETLQDTCPNYALSTQLNNIHFVAKCSHPQIDDANSFIFKSQPYNFDQFNWALDLLRLPTVPTAIKAFQGRIYAFDENNTYKIEPNNFYIEDTYEGIGCHGPDAVIVNEYGMFFADKNNLYTHNGTQPIPIGNPILRKVEGSSLGWHANTYGSETKILYDSFRNSVLFSFKGSGNTSYFWGYNISLRRWDLIKINDSYSPDGYFKGRDGSLYLSINSRLYYFFGSTSKRSWNWTSKQITAGQDTQVKKFKKFKITGTPSGSLGNSSTGIQCTLDGSSVTETGTVNEWTLSSQDGKKCQIFLNGQTGDVDSIGIILRRKPIK